MAEINESNSGQSDDNGGKYRILIIITIFLIIIGFIEFVLPALSPGELGPSTILEP